MIKVINYVNWEYSSSTKWCFDGNVLTRDPFWTRDVIVHGPLWQSAGHIDKSESGGKGDSSYEDYTEGHFRYCVGPGNIGCVINQYSDITKRQFADGRYEASGSD